MRYHVSVVAEFFIQMAVALPVFLLWYAVVALIGRAFGVRLPFRSLRQRNGTSQNLTFSQHMWLKGVLGWGCGMWIVTTFCDYLDWKLLEWFRPRSFRRETTLPCSPLAAGGTPVWLDEVDAGTGIAES
jgi:hypothetical protein